MKKETDWLVGATLEKFGPKAAERRVSEGQKKLEALTDDELMELDARLVEDFKPEELPLIAHQFADAAKCYDLLEEYDRTVTLMPCFNPGALFLAAVYREVHRRARAACLPWRRWRKPAECKKWLDHIKLIEEKASQSAREIFLK